VLWLASDIDMDGIDMRIPHDPDWDRNHVAGQSAMT
jgi:hypothetical protein